MKGLGTDIIEVDRIRKNLNEYGDVFLDKLLTEREKTYCRSFNDPAPILAGRFAAKESVAKALGCGFGESLSFHDIEIINDKEGKPEVFLSSPCKYAFNDPVFLISISHCKTHATAVAIRA